MPVATAQKPEPRTHRPRIAKLKNKLVAYPAIIDFLWDALGA